MDVQITCPCPTREGEPRHPDGDKVTLRESLDFRQVTAIRHNVSLLETDEAGNRDPGEVLATLTEGYVLYGIESWTLVDDKGKPLPVSRQAIREHVLSDVVTAAVIGDEADDLYGKKVLLPLLARALNSSQPSQTASSTSRSTTSQSSRPTPLRRSSTTTSPTADTGTTTTSPDGDSSSSQSSDTAA